jgi:hypothetical protein
MYIEEDSQQEKHDRAQEHRENPAAESQREDNGAIELRGLCSAQGSRNYQSSPEHARETDQNGQAVGAQN